MITASQKTLTSIANSIAEYQRVLILGCGTCVTVCMAGGEKEVGLLAEQIRLRERELPKEKRHAISEATIERQCDVEFFDTVRPLIDDAECVLSMACGVGVQHIVENFEGKIVLPALDTKFFGATEQPGVWVERCAGCGDCILDKTGGICPVARCSKSLFNGPCGGSQDGVCEISDEVECVWQLIYDRQKEIGRLDDLMEMIDVKDWSTARDGGPRKIVREDATV